MIPPILTNQKIEVEAEQHILSYLDNIPSVPKISPHKVQRISQHKASTTKAT